MKTKTVPKANVNDIIRHIVDLSMPRLHGQADVLLVLGEIPPVACNVYNLGYLFYHLIVTMTRSMPEPGEIRFTTKLLDDVIQIIVTNSSAPIKETATDDTSSTSEDHADADSLLDLPLCNDIVSAHGGAIKVTNVDGCTGISYIISLPSNRLPFHAVRQPVPAIRPPQAR